MNNNADPKDLLAEVLAEASPEDFRAAMLAETLRLARHRRFFRRGRQAAVALAVMGLLAVFVVHQFFWSPLVSPTTTEKSRKPAYELVRTGHLSAEALVGTRRFSETQFASPAFTVVEIATTRSGYRLINDDELLTLLGDRPAVLVRTGPHSEELVFANPDDRKLFAPN